MDIYSAFTLNYFYLIKGVAVMLKLVITFLILAIIAGVLGFSTIAGMSMDIAKILFFIFIVLFIISLIASIFRGKRPPTPPME